MRKKKKLRYLTMLSPQILMPTTTTLFILVVETCVLMRIPGTGVPTPALRTRTRPVMRHKLL